MGQPMYGGDRYDQQEEHETMQNEIGGQYHIEKDNTESVTKFPEIVCNDACYANVMWPLDRQPHGCIRCNAMLYIKYTQNCSIQTAWATKHGQLRGDIYWNPTIYTYSRPLRLVVYTL